MAALRGVKTQDIQHSNSYPRCGVGRQSLGGGTGAYSKTDGDVPASMIQNATGAKTFKVSGQQVHNTFHMKILATNVQSIRNKGREKELLEELTMRDWDVVCLNETWRRDKEELWKSSKGHLFLGSGWKNGGRGVAVIIHKRHTKGFKAFHATSERVCAADVDIHGARLRIISVYLPDGSYSDECVEATCEEISRLRMKAARIGRATVAAGDWNAVIGKRSSDEQGTLGPHGSGDHNARGVAMVRWAGSQNLSIASSFFHTAHEDAWSYKNGSVHKLLDYIVLDESLTRKLTDATLSDAIGAGTDHRTVEVVLKFDVTIQTTKKKRKNASRSNNKWAPKDSETFENDLEAKLAEARAQPDPVWWHAG